MVYKGEYRLFHNFAYTYSELWLGTVFFFLKQSLALLNTCIGKQDLSNIFKVRMPYFEISHSGNILQKCLFFVSELKDPNITLSTYVKNSSY